MPKAYWISAYRSVSNPDKLGPDSLAVQSAQLAADGRSVFLKVKDLKPVMQMQIHYDLKTADGEKVSGVLANTIHQLGR